MKKKRTTKKSNKRDISSIEPSQEYKNIMKNIDLLKKRLKL